LFSFWGDAHLGKRSRPKPYYSLQSHSQRDQQRQDRIKLLTRLPTIGLSRWCLTFESLVFGFQDKQISFFKPIRRSTLITAAKTV
jgi:hypothetical protein